MSCCLVLALTDARNAIVVFISKALELCLLRHCVRYTRLRRLYRPLVSEHLVEVACVVLRADLWLERCLNLTCAEASPVDVTEEGVRQDITSILASSA